MAPRPRRPPPGALDDWYHVLLRNDALTTQQRQEIIDAAGTGRAYRALPLLEVNCSPVVAGRLAAMAGVVAVLPALDNLTSTRPIAQALDHLLAIARLQHLCDPGPGVVGGMPAGSGQGYPVIRDQDGRKMIDRDPKQDRLTETAIMPVINMSLGTFPLDYPFLTNDLVNLATFGAAQQLLMVISAGNSGAHESQETMSAWAQSPWVLAVGATDDDEGLVLAAYSSRGTADKPDSGPQLVACGNSGLDPRKKGTSFAAPRVTFMAMVIAAAILQLRHALMPDSLPRRGVRLVGAGMVDSWGKGLWRGTGNDRVTLEGLPLVGPDVNAAAGFAALLARYNANLEVRGNASILRQILLEAARPMKGYGPHEVGKGFISSDIVLDYLAGFTGADVLRLFGSGAAAPELVTEAARFPLFDREALGVLRYAVQVSYPFWAADWKSGRAAWRRAPHETPDDLTELQRHLGVEIIPPVPFTAQQT